MKKLFLYVFLGLLWCNVGFAENKIKKIYGLAKQDLIYKCFFTERGPDSKSYKIAFNFIEEIFGAWVINEYAYNLSVYMPAKDVLVKLDDATLMWSDATENYFSSHLLTYKDGDLRSKENKTISIETYFYDYPNNELKTLGLEIEDKYNKLYNRNPNTIKEKDFLDLRNNFLLYTVKLRTLQEKIVKMEDPVTFNSTCNLQ
jgi:hypothetical protein|tara:strand:+ start:221 stop:823 length:603 start_codon:yes stop_codon:yes gene_type:complete